ncbi:MAG: homoserine kinase [Sulfolobaceae archaeon]
MELIRAYAYSSSANLGAGFDVLAVAHNAYRDNVEASAEISSTLRVRIEAKGVPIDPYSNSAGYAVLRLLEDLGKKYSITIKIDKGIPVGLGLGSSGASATAAVLAINELLNLGLSREELIYYAMLGEGAVAGSPHPDNVAASMIGGFVAVVSTNPIKVIKIPNKIDLDLLIFIPKVEIDNKTKKAREMVPKSIELKSYVNNSRSIASLLIGIIEGNRELIRIGLNDEIVEKSRLPLFPYYPKIKEIALKYDAIGSCVSGAGPSILVFIDKGAKKEKIIEEGKRVFQEYSLPVEIKLAKVAGGAEIERRD